MHKGWQAYNKPAAHSANAGCSLSLHLEARNSKMENGFEKTWGKTKEGVVWKGGGGSMAHQIYFSGTEASEGCVRFSHLQWLGGKYFKSCRFAFCVLEGHA